MKRIAIILSLIVGVIANWALTMNLPDVSLAVLVFVPLAILGFVAYMGMFKLNEINNPEFVAILSLCAQISLAVGILAIGTDLLSDQLASWVLMIFSAVAFTLFIYDLGQLISQENHTGLNLSVWDHVVDSIISVTVYSTLAWAGFWEPMISRGYSAALIGSYLLFTVNLAVVILQRLIALPRFNKALFDGLIFQVVIVGILTLIAIDPIRMTVPSLHILVTFSALLAISCWLPGGGHIAEVERLPSGLQVGRVLTVTLAAAYIPLTLAFLGSDNIGRLSVISLMVTLLLFFRMQAVISIRDREVRRVTQLASDLEYQAIHDLTTGLYNLTGLESILEQRLVLEHRDTAIVMIALEGFNHVNDIHGYRAGDQALRVLARRLERELRESDVAARFSGDEFIVLLDQVDHPELGSHLAARLIECIQEPCRLPGGEEVRLGACAGVALSTLYSHADLIRNAELALDSVRTSGRGSIQVADGTDIHKTMDSISREELFVLLTSNQLDCLYSPVMSLQDDIPAAMMIRPHWIHPGRVRDLVDYHHLNGPWFTWFFTRALQFHQATGAPIHMTVNANQLGSLELFPALDAVLSRGGTDGSWLTVSVDARTRINHIPREDFKQRGVNVALDSFGALGTNLTDLAHLPVDLLKIDPVLVRDMVADRGYRVVVDTVIRSSGIKGMPVVCRGIDTERIATVALSLGATYGQGRHWGTPMTTKDATDFWNTYARSPRNVSP